MHKLKDKNRCSALNRVSASAACSKVQHEQSKARACLSLLRFGGAVQPEVGVAMQVEEGLQHIQHLGHLGEDEGLVTASLQLVQQLCQLLQSYVVETPCGKQCMDRQTVRQTDKHTDRTEAKCRLYRSMCCSCRHLQRCSSLCRQLTCQL